MKLFTDLLFRLDQARGDSGKLAALNDYFSESSAAGSAWAAFLLSGLRLKTQLKNEKLRQWAQEWSGISDWLFDQCYSEVGDVCETIALILPPPPGVCSISLETIAETTFKLLTDADDDEQRKLILHAWHCLDGAQRSVFNKLVTGSFHSPVSFHLVVSALSAMAGLDSAIISQRLQSKWEPSAEFFDRLFAPDTSDLSHSIPYPFCLAHDLANEEQMPGDCSGWLAEWEWDGIRAQLIKRREQITIWSQQELLLTERLPELVEAASGLADGTVLDGQILAWKDSDLLPSELLQKRINRPKPTAAILAEIPVVFMAFDQLEEDGVDIRQRPIEFRLNRLADVLSSRSRVGTSRYEQLKLFAPCRTQLDPVLRLSPLLSAQSRIDLETLRARARQMRVEGLLLKQKGSIYTEDPQSASWLKWRREPLKVNAVLASAQAGQGRQSGLFADFTFSLWHDGELLSFARASSDLADAELMEIDTFIRENTLARFGPVRSVKPELVFELACDGIQASQRYKSGINVRRCRVLQWRRDLAPTEAHSFADIEKES